MKITQIKWHNFGKPGDNTLAMGSVVFDDALVVHEVRVVRGKQRVYVTYPNKNDVRGDKLGAAHPIRDDARAAWEKQILASYKEAVKKKKAEPGSALDKNAK